MMNKTMIIVTQGLFETLQLEQLKAESGCRVVIMLLPHNQARVTDAVKPFVDQVYLIPSQNSRLGSEDFFNYPQLKAAVEKEVALVGSPEDIYFVCASEHNASMIGRLRDELWIPGPGEAQLLRYRDKTIMKAVLREHGLRVPHFTEMDLSITQAALPEYFRFLEDKLGLPFIVKPVDGAGAVETHKVKSYADFEQYYPACQQANVIFEAEEFIDGTLYHYDTLMRDNHLQFEVVSEYFHPCATYHQGRPLGSIILPEDDEQALRLKEYGRKALSALGRINGTMHMELFINSAGEVIFLEVAARPAGAAIMPTYEAWFGVNLMEADARIQLGLPLPEIKRHTDEFLFKGWIANRSGTVKATNEPQGLLSQVEFSWSVKPGDVIDQPSQEMRAKAGEFTVRNQDYDQLRQDFFKFRDENYQPLHVE